MCGQSGDHDTEMDDPRVLFGKRLRRIRVRKGWSQEELAHRAGVDRTYVSGIERGIRNPSLINICKLADTLGVKPATLMNF